MNTRENRQKITAINNHPGYFLNVISSLFPYLLLIVAIAGFIVAYKMNGSAINSLVYVVPVILAAVILFTKSRNTQLDISTYTNKLQFSHLFLLTILLFIISIISLTSSSSRPLAYFIIISLISGTIFTQILCKRQSWTDYLIVFEINLLSLNLIWGITLKYPLYFGYTDILVHLHYIDTIVQTAHIAQIGVSYQNFPLYHIFNAIGSETTGLSLRDALFIFMGIAWQIGILFVFLIFKKLSNSNKIALIGCLLFALSTELIFYGAYAITRSLAFVMLLCWLYLIFNKIKARYIFLSLIAMCTLILTHHVTVLFIIPLLLLVYVCQKLVSKQDSEGIPFLPISLLFIVFFTYLIYPAHILADSVFPVWIHSILSSEGPTETIAGSINQSVSLLGLMYYSFVLFLSLIGIGTVFKVNIFNNKYLNVSGIALASLVFLFLYVSGPINFIPQAQIVLAYRFPLLVSPFIIVAMTYGVVYLLSFKFKLKLGIFHITPLPILTLGLIMTSTFFSTISGPNAPDYPYWSYPMSSGSEYFTNSELESFSFMNRNANSSLTLYGDSETVRNEFSLNPLQPKLALTGGDIRYINNGYVVLRLGEMKRRGGLSFSLDENLDKTYRFYVKPSDQRTDILSNLSTKDRIYSNGDVQILMIQESISSPIQ